MKLELSLQAKRNLVKSYEAMSPENLQYSKEFLSEMGIDLDKLLARLKKETEQIED